MGGRDFVKCVFRIVLDDKIKRFCGQSIIRINCEKYGTEKIVKKNFLDLDWCTNLYICCCYGIVPLCIQQSKTH